MFYGMDTAQGEEFAQLMGERRGTLAGRADELDGLIRGIADAWVGPDADAFRDRWDALHRGPFEDALDLLMELARTLSADAQEQDAASSASDFGAFFEFLEDIFRGDGFSWRNFLPNPNDWEDWVGMGLSGLLDGLEVGLKTLSRVLSDPRMLATVLMLGGDDLMNAVKGAAGSAKAFSKVLGPIGTAVTAGFAGWDRWEQDSSDPSLSTGERWTRAIIDGGANAAGGGLGAWGGGALGAAIGTAICPGVGTVIGGAVGAALGGLGGSSVANGIVDWVLG